MTKVVIDLSVVVHQMYRKLNAVTKVSELKPRWFTDPSILANKINIVTEAIEKTPADKLDYLNRLLVEKTELEAKAHAIGMVHAQMRYVMSLEWLGKYKPTDEVTIILASDTKPYWRLTYLERPSVFLQATDYQAEHTPSKKGLKARLKKADRLKELLPIECPDITTGTESEWSHYRDLVNERSGLIEDLKINYKAGRKFPDPSFTKLKEGIYAICDDQGWNRIAVKGYEADDIAASVVHLNNLEAEPETVILCTVDTDWLGLVNDHTHWVDIGCYFPRYRGDLPSINAWLDKKQLPRVENPRDIWAMKVRDGDSSDALPPGTPIEVIDLLAPPAEFRLWEKDYFLSRYYAATPAPLPDSKPATEYLSYLGCRLCIEPLEV